MFVAQSHAVSSNLRAHMRLWMALAREVSVVQADGGCSSSAAFMFQLHSLDIRHFSISSSYVFSCA